MADRILEGRKALVVGVANAQSVAHGCARALGEAGAALALTWLNERARPHVEPLARDLGAEIVAPLDVTIPDQLEELFETIRRRWGRLDILVHSIAHAPPADLRGPLLDCSPEGFARAMDVSCHSFIRMARLAAPMMTDGGAMFAMSFLGAARVAPNYGLMGPVKAALEASCRYLAHELGPRNIRVHALSTGLLPTRAASGIRDFDQMRRAWAERAPLGEIDALDIGRTCVFLASPFARRLTGETIHVDGGMHLF